MEVLKGALTVEATDLEKRWREHGEAERGREKRSASPSSGASGQRAGKDAERRKRSDEGGSLKQCAISKNGRGRDRTRRGRAEQKCCFPKGSKYQYGTKYGFCNSNFPYGLGKYSPYGYLGPFGFVHGETDRRDRSWGGTDSPSQKHQSPCIVQGSTENRTPSLGSLREGP